LPRIKLDELERGAFARIGGRMFQFRRLQNMACRNWILRQVGGGGGGGEYFTGLSA